ncbi:hypothetical protein LLG07_04990 [bacterium]|nr:hypothetical protein [bacterium]
MDEKISKRTQILLTDRQFKKLKEIADYRETSMGFLIREAIDTVYLDKKKNKEKLVEKLISMNLPVSDWEDMKKEILEGRFKKLK